MQLIATSRVYDFSKDSLHEDFAQLMREPPRGFDVIEGNAGLGADWPAAVWKSATALGLALTILGAPATIEENWPKWVKICERAKELMLDFHTEFAIDRDTAQVIAIHHAAAVEGMDSSRINIHLAVRHFFSNFFHYEDLLTSERVDIWYPESAKFGCETFSRGIRSNEEAARQIHARYVLGIDDRESGRTIVVERDGQVSFSRLIY